MGIFRLVVMLAWLAACAGSGEYNCQRDPATGSSQCLTSGNDYSGGVVTTAAAAVVYSAVGCTVNGCLLPDMCNHETKRCEAIKCSETNVCPTGYRCVMSTHTCR